MDHVCVYIYLCVCMCVCVCACCVSVCVRVGGWVGVGGAALGTWRSRRERAMVLAPVETDMGEPPEVDALVRRPHACPCPPVRSAILCACLFVCLFVC